MYKGEPSEGKEFFDLLFKSDEFNAELGKVILAAGRLEAEMILFLIRKGITQKLTGYTLGRLINIGKEHNLFDKNFIIALDTIKEQRNYLTHNIFSLLTGQIEETILEGRGLLDSDVNTYLNRAWQLKVNLIDLADIISEE